MMTTSWCCARVSARFEARDGAAGDDVAHEEFMAAGMFRGFRIELGQLSSRGRDGPEKPHRGFL